MKPRQGRIVEVGRKDFAEQHIIPNVQCHQLAIVQQMIKRVTCTIVHSELGLQEPSRSFGCGGWKLGDATYFGWPNQAFKMTLNVVAQSKQTYSKARDAAQVYEVKVKTIAAKQGSKTVIEYANQLKALWQELDHYRVIKTKCPEDAAVLKDFIEQDRVYDFLVGLNPEFDQVRIQILGSEESQRSVTLEPQTLDGSTLVAKIEYSEQGKNDLPKHLGRDNQWKENKDNLWCTFYHSVCVLFPNWISRGNQRDRDRERAASRNPSKGSKGKDDGLTPEQRRESAFLCVELDCLDRDAKALQEKAAKKAGQAASGGSGDAGGLYDELGCAIHQCDPNLNRE
uniref:Small EDRK-rich factor-like N-terminal domain-containing protein n=1 Tax=Vitis vinifera TaxID=29760 RepID=A5AXN0_VITVI|nr:hypothetical protein VITISV_042513 [Vitis vinifera]